jgi:hypothetical protein
LQIDVCGNSPAVLFCTPRGLSSSPGVDLDLLRDLHAAGFQTDYLDHLKDFTWERIRQYNVLVLIGAPSEEEKRHFYFPAEGPRQTEYIELIDRFLDEGGGVFAMIYTDSGDQHVQKLVEKWDARLPLEKYFDSDAENIVPVPRMPVVSLGRTDNILPSPISAGVTNLWFPYGDYYHATLTGPIFVGDDWQVVAKGPATSYTEPAETNDFIQSSYHQDPFVRRGGVKEPDLIAIRPYKNGRILLCTQMPQFSLIQGTHWLFDRLVLSKGLQGIPSDFERLVQNAFEWLAEPSLKSEGVGGYRVDPRRFDPPNFDPVVRKDFETKFWSKEELELHGPVGKKIFKGLIGAQTTHSGGEGTVEEYAAAAKDAGLDFVIFLEVFANLTPEKLQQLGEECKKHSDETLRLLPGYRMDTNIGDHMFFTGHDLPWPPAHLLTGPEKVLFTLQTVNEEGEFHHDASIVHWILAEHDRYGKNMIGFYHMENPEAMQPIDLKDCSAVALLTYQDGKLLEDRTEEYVDNVEGTLPPLPMSLNLVRSPEALRNEVKSGHALTYAQARSLETLPKDALRWNNQYESLNVFPSTGPIIRAWPQHYRSHTYGSEPFVVDRDLMVSDLHVTSNVGLKEIRIMNGRRLFRRYLPGGAKSFKQQLHLPGNIQQYLLLTAEDLEGGKAIGFPRISWKAGALPCVYCGDHVNDCGRFNLARGSGLFNSHRFPILFGGTTWDGGPKGIRPVLRFNNNYPYLKSDLGLEGGAEFRNTPIMEFSDEQAIVVRSELLELYDERLPVHNPWHAFGPKYPTKLMHGVRRYMEFNRPSTGVRPTGWAAICDRSGAVVANYSCSVTFLQDLVVQFLPLMFSNRYEPRPFSFIVGDGGGYREHKLTGEAKSAVVNERIAKGQWFGFFAGQAFNNVLFINRGEPFVVSVYPENNQWKAEIVADIEGRHVKAGDEYYHELFSVNEAVGITESGPDRFQRVLRYLEAPDGMEIVRGNRQPSPGFFEVSTKDPGDAVELTVPRPAEAIGITIPVRVSGLNSRWSTGLFQVKGHSTGYYSDGSEVYTSLGFDFDDRVYAALYPDQSEKTHVVIGHPVVCDEKDLFIEVMPRSGPEGGYLWHVAVNNPTDEGVRAKFEVGMKLPGLDFAKQQHTIPAGAHVVLNE